MINLEETAYMIHRNSKDKGFYEAEVDVNFLLSKLALVISEVIEVLEAIRKDKGEDEIVEELSDTFIRVLDFYEALKENGFISKDFKIEDEITKKMAKNSSRPHRHGVLA